MDKGYSDLYCAIYKQAVEDDYRKVCAKVSEELKLIGIDKFTINKYIGTKAEFIKDSMKKAVYQESFSWGSEDTKRMSMNSVKRIARLIIDEYAYGTMTAICPECGRIVDKIFKHDYCENCGQKLDWQEGE